MFTMPPAIRRLVGKHRGRDSRRIIGFGFFSKDIGHGESVWFFKKDNWTLGFSVFKGTSDNWFSKDLVFGFLYWIIVIQK